MQIQNPDPHDRPIGFWVKAVDKALDSAIDALHAQAGFNRRRWQVLNVVAAHSPCTLESINDALHPMLRLDEIEPDLEALADRKMVELSGSRLWLTNEGRDRLAELSLRQDALRCRAAEGIDAEAYSTTVSTLARMLANLSTE